MNPAIRTLLRLLALVWVLVLVAYLMSACRATRPTTPTPRVDCVANPRSCQ